MTRRQLRSVNDDSPRCPRSSALCHICLQLPGVPLPICCIQVFRRRPGGLLQFIPRLWPPFIAMTWHNVWCAGVVASSLTTWPKSAWRLLLIISTMFGRPVLSAMSTFFIWFCHFTPSIWRWHDIWKDCNLQ